MLRITYTGGDAPQRWLFDADQVDVLEAEKIEGALARGETWDDFLMGLASPSTRLRRVLLWHLLRRTNPDYDMPFAEAPIFKMGQLKIEMGTTELRRIIDSYKDNDRVPAARRDAVIATLEQEYAEAALAEAELSGDEVTADPKEQQPAAPPAGAPGSHPAEGVPPEAPPTDVSPTTERNISLSSPPS